MDRKALKQALRYAKDGAVHVAFAQGPDGKAVVQLHRRKMGRALEMELRGASPEARNFRWGTLEVDPGEPKQALVKVNKSVSGMSRRLVLAFKGTGISKVRLLPQDGGEAEAYEEEDEEAQEEEAQEDGAAPSQAGEVEDAAARTSTGPGAGDGVDAAGVQASPATAAAPDDGGDGREAQAVKAELVGLVERMLEAIRRDPSQKAELSKLAMGAQASLKQGDVEQAAAGAEALRTALDAAEKAGAGGTGGPGSGQANAQANGQANGQAAGQDGAKDTGQSHGASHPAAPVIDKAMQAWGKTREQIEKSISALTKQFEAAFTDHEMAGEISASFKARVDTVLHNLDEELSDKLAEVNASHDAASRTKLVDEARKVIARYTQHIGSDETIKHLDENPFVPMQLGKMLTATLGTLSKSIR